ncbi:hypothetical protein [Lysobacter sp. M2-1]|uniref:hypothetical protein n=1 Tax=Lysobacter sp. M2-1 TaxID=2916839 RepID=UPI001F5AE1B0|nr:hypothetical protein [Lysobacter sp. M2-1]
MYALKASLEEQLPGDARGAFIGVNQELNALQAVSRILSEAEGSALVVDPYLNHEALFELLNVVSEGIELRLLADSHYTALNDQARAGVVRWRAQYGAGRPVSLRLTQPRALHDRAFILGGGKVYLVSQSLKDIARRSPATISRAEPDVAALKRTHYEQLWDDSGPTI